MHKGRTLHGVRGLKSYPGATMAESAQSHPSRGAWIEITKAELETVNVKGRTLHGVRGLKYQPIIHILHKTQQVAPFTGCVD